MQTRYHLALLREQIGCLLLDKKSIIVAEVLAVLLLPLVWTLLPLTRTIIPLLLLAWLSLWFRQLSWRTIGLSRPKSWPITIITGVVIGALAVLFGVIVIAPLFRLISGTTNESTFVSLRDNLPLLLFLVIVTWPLAALLEEMVYRGYLLNRMTDLFGKSKQGWTISIILSATMFSLAHGRYDLKFMVTSFLSGMLEGWLYLTSQRNLWLPIIAHGMINTLSFTLAFLGV